MDNKGADLSPAYPETQQQPQGQYPQWQGQYPQQQGQYPQQQGQYPQHQAQYPQQQAQYPQQQGQYPQQQGQYGGRQQVYVMQPVVPVIVSQRPVVQEFIFPKGKVPSIILLVCAIANFLCYIVVGALSGVWDGTAWLPGFFFYGIAGILGSIGSFATQRHQGIAIGTIVMATFSMIVSFSEIILEVSAVAVYSIQYAWPNLIMLLFGLAAFSCSIALVVIASQVACDCCRPRRQ
ncbi:uncharacterized protein LOC135498875 isoform X1 [Lineus longissimus]|uniref:uncharacterized protein LOC135498875 isoform X1 n=1 Tax=Lineus longissimus TaxID=88925 RepID=UPI00315D7263